MSLGSAILELITDSTKYEKGLSEGEKRAQMFGKLAVGGFTIAAAGAAALAAAALKIGGDFDAAYDKIQIQTGATGDKLETLSADFRSVFSQVPVSMEAASGAIATLHQRTGLAGPALQELAVQYLNLGRTADVEVNPFIETTQRVFAAWGVETAKQGPLLDALQVAAQKTGIGVDTLAGSVDQFGPILRATGFDLTTSIALIAQMEKAGIPAETVVSGLGIAAKNFAKENIPLNEGLEKAVAKIKEMGPSAEATKLSVDTFGRSGVILADAIHKGAFTIDQEMIAALKNADGNINETAKSTDDWTQKLDVMKNKLLVAVAPAAEKVFNGLGALIEWVTPYVEQIAMWIGENLPGAMDAAGSALQELQPLFSLLGDVLGWLFQNVLPLVGEAFQIVGGTIRNVISAVQTLVGWLRDAWTWANNAASAASNAVNQIPGVAGLRSIMGFQHGTDHITKGPEVFVAGEAGPERVTVTPLRGSGNAAAAGGHGHDVVLDGRVVGGLLGRRTVRGTAFAGGSIG